MAVEGAGGTEAQRSGDADDGAGAPGAHGIEDTTEPRRRFADLVWFWPIPAVTLVAVASEFDGRRGAALATATVMVIVGTCVAQVARSQGLALSAFAVAVAALAVFAWTGPGHDGPWMQPSSGKPVAGRTPTSDELRRERDLRGAAVGDTPLRGADLDGRLLQGVKADGADLAGASLVGTRLDGAHLTNANLRGASLRGACLRGADLRGTKIDGADFSGADVQGTVGVTDERLAIGFGGIPTAGACR